MLRKSIVALSARKQNPNLEAVWAKSGEGEQRTALRKEKAMTDVLAFHGDPVTGVPPWIC